MNHIFEYARRLPGESPQLNKEGRQQGFTLMELMIIVAIVGVLVAFAFPNYLDYAEKARRSDGMDALLHLQNLQEKWRANNTTYGNNLASIGATNTSLEGHYTIAITASSVTGFTATATGGANQAGDEEDGTSCTVLTMTVDASNPRGRKTPVECW